MLLDQGHLYVPRYLVLHSHSNSTPFWVAGAFPHVQSDPPNNQPHCCPLLCPGDPVTGSLRLTPAVGFTPHSAHCTAAIRPPHIITTHTSLGVEEKSNPANPHPVLQLWNYIAFSGIAEGLSNSRVHLCPVHYYSSSFNQETYQPEAAALLLEVGACN